jgi:hypothetical protein
MQKHERKGVAEGATGEVVENKGAKIVGSAGLRVQVRLELLKHS